VTTGVNEDEIPRWPSRLLRAQLTMRVGASREDALDVLAAALDSVGFKPKDRTPDGFRALWFKWGWMLFGETAYRTELLVRADGDAIWIGVGRHAMQSRPRAKAVEGLNVAVREFRRRGVAVHWTEWTQQPR
jgi:hypothetical protein